MAESEQDLVGKHVDQRYELLHRLGQGGAGTVFAAFDQTAQTNVALKLLRTGHASDQAIKRMKREIKVLLLVEDPRMIQLIDWGHDGELGLYYTMELLNGSQTLKDYIENEDPSLKERLELFADFLLALLSLHRLRAIHRGSEGLSRFSGIGAMSRHHAES